MNADRQFLVLESFELETGFLVVSAKIAAADVLRLEPFGNIRLEDIDAGPAELDNDAIQRISETYGIRLNSVETWTTVRRPSRLDFLPYEVHTNREFDLMINGSKPLSVFSEYLAASEIRLNAISAKFRPYVNSSRFVERRYTRFPAGPSNNRDAISMLLIARTPEEWRIDAYQTLMASADSSQWTEGFERMQGFLLGYEAWQTEAHLNSK